MSTTPPVHPNLDALDPALLEAVVCGAARLSPEQALDLYHRCDPQSLGRLADRRCRQLHGDTIRTYVIDRNINYTNICTAKCIFCAFKRTGDEEDAYTLDHDALLEKVRELVEIGGTQILMQGGMNPELGLDWYIDLLQRIKSEYPQVHVHAFSPPEFIEFVHFFDPPGKDLKQKILHVMKRLREAGLDSLPGGGGEIFAPAVRSKIGMGKCDAESWLTVMRAAHEIGFNTSATMMFGHIEGIADRVHHMDLVRQRQDCAIEDLADEGGGRYMAFISWPFQSDNTVLGKAREWGIDPQESESGEFPGDVVARLDGSGRREDHPKFGRRRRMAGPSAYLRTQALSRLFLDNIYSIGSSWVTMGPHIGQMGLLWGANDMGSVMMEENVVSSAGSTHCLNEPMICRLIRDAGFIPAQRDNAYDLLKVHDGPDAPDLMVEDWSACRPDRLLSEQSPEAEPDGCGSSTSDEGPSVTLTVRDSE